MRLIWPSACRFRINGMLTFSFFSRAFKSLHPVFRRRTIMTASTAAHKSPSGISTNANEQLLMTHSRTGCPAATPYTLHTMPSDGSLLSGVPWLRDFEDIEGRIVSALTIFLDYCLTP